MRILLVEDDELLGDGVRDALERARHAVEWVRDGRHALTALGGSAFDLAILDLGLPGLDGIEVLRSLRARGGATPVLVLTARDAPAQRVAGLDAGADDYLTKPFDLDELLARVRALQRRARGAAVNVIEHGPLRLDPGSFSVTCEGRAVELQRREFMLLHKLLESAGQVLSRAQLEESLYGWEGGVESNTLDVHIHRLRRKLYPDVIRTVRGVGYVIDPAPQARAD
ncbi:MAG: response regulator transcription factor [Betaproteobacteria bacterium]|nr:response regulator transcription factor [Betaproteobacteria bacterium]MDH5351435.1 response regulator transcription factor [Betaproteobacteria bacterium]